MKIARKRPAANARWWWRLAGRQAGNFATGGERRDVRVSDEISLGLQQTAYILINDNDMPHFDHIHGQQMIYDSVLVFPLGASFTTYDMVHRKRRHDQQIDSNKELQGRARETARGRGLGGHIYIYMHTIEPLNKKDYQRANGLLLVDSTERCEKTLAWTGVKCRKEIARLCHKKG